MEYPTSHLYFHGIPWNIPLVTCIFMVYLVNKPLLKISHLPSKLRFSVKCSFFGQSLSRGQYQPTYQPPEGVYLLNIVWFSEFTMRVFFLYILISKHTKKQTKTKTKKRNWCCAHGVHFQRLRFF